jgi:DnaK suppressor protein
MEARLMERFKRELLKERERLLNGSRKARRENALAVPAEDLSDDADLAAHEVQQNLVFQLRNRERDILNEISLALQRIDDGSFGICEETEEPIEIERLTAVPWTRFSLAGADIREKRMKKFA